MPYSLSPEVVFILALTADTIGIVGAVFAALAWLWAKRNNQRENKEKERLNQRIPVVLKSTESNRSLELPVHFRREELTREELMGRIGMLPLKDGGWGFSLDYLRKPNFLEEINRISVSDIEETFIIYCTDNEIDQFDNEMILSK